VKRKISVEDIDPVHLYGRNDMNLRLIQDAFAARVTARGGEITIVGDDDTEVQQIEAVLTEMANLVRRGRTVRREDVEYAVRMVTADRAEELSRFYQMLLNGGSWQGEQVLQEATVARAVRPRRTRFAISIRTASICCTSVSSSPTIVISPPRAVTRAANASWMSRRFMSFRP